MYEIMKVILQSMHADTLKVIRNKTGALTCVCTGEVQCNNSHSILHLMRWRWSTDVDLCVQQWAMKETYLVRMCFYTKYD